MCPVDEVILSSQNINTENENELPKYIKELRRLLAEDSIALPANDDMLIRFIRGRKFDVERARKTVKRYINMRKKYSNLLQGMHPRCYEACYAQNAPTVFVNRDSKGRHILLVRTRKWNPSEINLINGLCAIYVMIEGMIGYIETQRCGISVILDLKDLTFYQARQMNYKCLQIIGDILQDTLPISFQEIHIVNHPMMFNMVYALIKPILKEKIRKRVHFHGYNVKSIHKFINPNILPHNLGGNLTNQEAWDLNFIPRLFEQDDYYKEYFQSEEY